jgi:hypothetical protein
MLEMTRVDKLGFPFQNAYELPTSGQEGLDEMQASATDAVGKSMKRPLRVF